VIVDGIAYSQDLDSNVRAIELESGRVLWEKRYAAPAYGPNGVLFARGHVYGATPTKAFALNARTGKQEWATVLGRNKDEEIAMAPGYRRGLVYLATSPGEFDGGEVGVLWALDAKTGRRVWHFDTVPRALWGHPEINYGGGVTYAPAFDDEGGMYIGTRHAGPIAGTERYPWGSSRPGPNLYSDSIVKLDAKTGRLEWYYQVTPHGLCKWDIGAPTVVQSNGRDLVVTGGLSGVVVALDSRTGALVWRRVLGKHNGHDDDGLLAMRGEYASLKTPMTVYPGRYGGVFGQVSTDGETLFVPVVNGATKLFSQLEGVDAGRATGELVALDVASGRTRWVRKFPAPVYSATTTTNDVVFSASADGRIRAFDVAEGYVLWSKVVSPEVNAGLAVSGKTLLVPAGYALGREDPILYAYRISG
jgi:alcohol dehydrogenase (cytochrome c)